jgi:hypothetical protein
MSGCQVFGKNKKHGIIVKRCPHQPEKFPMPLSDSGPWEIHGDKQWPGAQYPLARGCPSKGVSEASTCISLQNVVNWPCSLVMESVCCHPSLHLYRKHCATAHHTEKPPPATCLFKISPKEQYDLGDLAINLLFFN